MNALTLGGSAIRQLDGLYSLNDLHAAAGGAEKHQPNRFLRLAQTKALAAEIEQTPDLALAIKSVRGGANPGSYVCRELVYAYAMWISPAFNLKVIRAFDAAQAAPADAAWPGIAAALSPEQYQAARAQVEAMQAQLEAASIVIPAAEYDRLTGERIKIGRKTMLVQDFVGLMEHHRVPREIISEMIGINNNTVRQHALIARRKANKGGAQ